MSEMDWGESVQMKDLQNILLDKKSKGLNSEYSLIPLVYTQE